MNDPNEQNDTGIGVGRETPPTKDTPDKLSERLRDEARRLYGVPGYGNAIPIMQQSATALDSLQAQLDEAMSSDARKTKEINILVKENRAQAAQLSEAQKQLAAAKAEVERLGKACAEMREVLQFYHTGCSEEDCAVCHSTHTDAGKDYIPRDSIKPQMELLGECLLLFVNISRKSSTNLWYMPFIAQLIKRAAELGVRP